MELVLASGSKWRKGLLDSAGIPCRGVAPDVDEYAIVADTPALTAAARARAKAHAVARTVGPSCLVIGADQVVHLEGVVLAKPCDERAHVEMLTMLRGRTHELLTAVALVRPRDEGFDEREFQEITTLTMRADLGGHELAAYAANGEASGCGGGYMIERLGAQLFSEVRGDWNNVVGLPLFRLITELRALGWRPAFAPSAAGGGGAG